jgi:hypothetical protein
MSFFLFWPPKWSLVSITNQEAPRYAIPFILLLLSLLWPKYFPHNPTHKNLSLSSLLSIIDQVSRSPNTTGNIKLLHILFSHYIFEKQKILHWLPDFNLSSVSS